MKNLLILLVVSTVLLSCKSVKQIGKINMISNRNIDNSIKYEQITTYSGGSKRDVRKSRAKSVEDAIDQTVRNVPGGEYLMNAKIYIVDDKYIAVEGDVWGLKNNASFMGFKVGDKVTWKLLNGSFKTGVIKSFKDSKICLVEIAETSELVEKKYDDLIKVD